jgi:hypothetical protein
VDHAIGRVRFGLIVHHTDVEREYAYDRQSHFGRLDKAATRWSTLCNSALIP